MEDYNGPQKWSNCVNVYTLPTPNDQHMDCRPRKNPSALNPTATPWYHPNPPPHEHQKADLPRTTLEFVDEVALEQPRMEIENNLLPTSTEDHAWENNPAVGDQEGELLNAADLPRRHWAQGEITSYFSFSLESNSNMRSEHKQLASSGIRTVTGVFAEQTATANTYRGELLGLMAVHLLLLSVNKVNPSLSEESRIISDCLGALKKVNDLPLIGSHPDVTIPTFLRTSWFTARICPSKEYSLTLEHIKATKWPFTYFPENHSLMKAVMPKQSGNCANLTPVGSLNRRASLWRRSVSTLTAKK